MSMGVGVAVGALGLRDLLLNPFAKRTLRFFNQIEGTVKKSQLELFFSAFTFRLWIRDKKKEISSEESNCCISYLDLSWILL